MLLGQQTPTYYSAPASVGNAAAEVADLMTMVGQPPDPWQRFTWQLWLGERADGSWAAFECACFVQRQDGKGALTEGRELGGLFLFGEKKIIHTAHRIDTAKEAFTRCANLVDGRDDLTRRVKRINRVNGEEAIELMSGATLEFRTRIRGSGRGLAGCECLVLDEALYLKTEHLDALAPTMLAAPNAQICYTSTPPESPEAHIMGVLARIKAGADRLAGTAWVSEQGVDVNDPAVRAAVNPAYNTRITDERMADVRKLLGEEGFARECIGIWPRPPEEGWLELSEQTWLGAGDAGSVAQDPVAFSIDVTPSRSFAAIAAVGARADADLHGEVVEHARGTDWAVARLVELVVAHRPAAVSLVGTAAAFTLYAELSQALKAAGSLLEVKVMTNREVAAAYGMTVDAIRSTGGARRLRWRTDRHGGALSAAVKGAVGREIGEGTAWDRAHSSVDISPLVALTNAVYTFVSAKVPPPVAVGSSPTTTTGQDLYSRGRSELYSRGSSELFARGASNLFAR